MTSKEELIQAVAVTAELCGMVMSPAAAKVMVDDLSAYDPSGVVKALAKCRRELTGRLSVAEIVKRIDDGRPGVEEAWAMLPTGEDDSVCWTEEMRDAYRIASGLIADGDRVAARMAFKEAYQSAITLARELGNPVVWALSLGMDKRGREACVAEAVQAGRIQYDYAAENFPDLAIAFEGEPVKLLAGITKPLSQGE